MESSVQVVRVALGAVKRLHVDIRVPIYHRVESAVAEMRVLGAAFNHVHLAVVRADLALEEAVAGDDAVHVTAARLICEQEEKAMTTAFVTKSLGAAFPAGQSMPFGH
jgi:hypothetical protein